MCCFFILFFHHLRRVLPLSFSYNNILICSGSSTSRASYSYSSCRLLLHLVVVVSFLIWLVHTALRQRRILIRLRLSSRVESSRNSNTHTHIWKYRNYAYAHRHTDHASCKSTTHSVTEPKSPINFGWLGAQLCHCNTIENVNVFLFVSSVGFEPIWFFQYCDAKSATVCHADTCHRRSNNQAIIIYQMPWLILNSRIRSNGWHKVSVLKTKNYA